MGFNNGEPKFKGRAWNLPAEERQRIVNAQLAKDAAKEAELERIKRQADEVVRAKGVTDPKEAGEILLNRLRKNSGS